MYKVWLRGLDDPLFIQTADDVVTLLSWLYDTKTRWYEQDKLVTELEGLSVGWSWKDDDNGAKVEVAW